MKFLKEHLTLIAAIAGAVSFLGAGLLKVDEKIVYSIIILATILLVALATWARSYFDDDEEQNLLYTFAKNDLVPNKSKKFLGSKTDIAMIGAEDSALVCENFVREFHKVKQLKITPFICDASNVELQTDRLKALLAGAESVLVVRTEELEKHPWVYEILDAWASRHSHVPCLLIDKIQIDQKQLEVKLNSIPEKYFFIPDDRASFPWRLLKRANERTRAWRNQASFNRMTALALLVLLGTGILFTYFQSRNYYIIIQNQRRQNYKVLQDIYTIAAKHTKDDYEQSRGTNQDKHLNLSYWITFGGTYYPLSSTELEHSHRIWHSTDPSIVGCAFAWPSNRSAQWHTGLTRPVVISLNGEMTPEDARCSYGKELQRTLTSIVCVSFNRSGDINNTVGVCLFTDTKDDDLNNQPTVDFLKERSQEFYEAIFPLLNEKKVVPVETELIRWREN